MSTPRLAASDIKIYAEVTRTPLSEWFYRALMLCDGAYHTAKAEKEGRAK